jgi:protoporphyrin/coproporphyrin ferrochelatase
VTHSFDAVLVIAFGGPQSPSDIHPFLANVLRGRRVAPGRIDEVAHHYELVGGRSPLTELTMNQADGMRARLAALGTPLPVYIGMRNWHPYLTDTLRAMSQAGIRRAVGFIAAAHRSYSSCTQYRENVAEARAVLKNEGLADVEVTYVGDWYEHPSFVAANADRVDRAFSQLDPSLRDEARLVFTAHSIPESMAERYPYRQQFEATAKAVAERITHRRDSSVATVYQSRSGRPEDPWLGPDICDYLRDVRRDGATAVVVSPIGFICDHVEVLYDLDIEAAAVAKEIGLTLVRAGSVNDHPLFVDMMADTVLQVCRRYDHARPLELVARA